MRMHSIEVDDEVFDYLKSRAEPFIDTPNSTLRRELRIGSKPGRTVMPTAAKAPAAMEVLPAVPAGTPKALEQILQVSYLVHRCRMPRLDATRRVAKKHGVFLPTVQDKYCRQLDLTADRFDSLVQQDDLQELKVLLRRKFSSFAILIDEYLTGNESPGAGKLSMNG